MSPDKDGWALEQGDEIVPGRLALAPLGGGTRYETYLAWDSRLFTTVVAKLLRPEYVDDERARRELQAEADIVLRLNHPIILRAYGVVTDGARPHLVLEHLDGPTLRATIRRQRGRVTLEELLPLALHLTSALHYLGQEEIVHLDVKPSNIVMGPVPRLIDFSIARDVPAARRAGKNLGTRLYMAPEQCEPGQRGEIGPPADIWAVGMCLYQAAVGKRPFATVEGEFPEGHPQLRGSIDPFPRQVPPDLAEVIEACLRPDPSARPDPASLALLLEPLVAALATPRPTRRGLRYRSPREIS